MTDFVCFSMMCVCQGDPSVVDISRHLQTGEMLIITTVLLMWAGDKFENT